MIDVPHKSDDRCARFQFLRFFNDGWWRRDDDLFNLVYAPAFFAALFFENEAVTLGDLGGDIGFDRLIDVRENIEVHQLGDELVRFQAKLGRELLHNNRRLDVNDVLRGRFGFGSSRFNCGRSIGRRCRLRGFRFFRGRGRGFQRGANSRDRRQNCGFLFYLAVSSFLLRVLLVD